ncbi:MAG TPA: glycosyltransferase [Acidimicrobiales bacterium]|jgi:putative flippase GtrA|nr:glycosyltransferase [Acidimicrobiales bacterium]
MAIAETVIPTQLGLSKPPDIEIVIPVYNEEAVLEANVRTLRTYLDKQFPFTTLVSIADNASSDGTWPIAAALAATTPGVQAFRLRDKGRGRALRAVWTVSRAQVVAYMDVDLATDLDALLPLIAPLLSGHSDLAIGTRLAPGARVVRGTKRELISRCYNVLIRALLRNRFTDAQCGFKAARAEVARDLLPTVSNEEWFFDTELLVRAERSGMRIHEVPVDWVDDLDSRVDVLRTALEDLRGVCRLLSEFALARGMDRNRSVAGHPMAGTQLARFASIGVVSTVVDLGLFLLLRPLLGPMWANAGALALCSIANMAANGRITFSDRVPFRRRGQLLGVLAVFATSLALTSLALLAVAGIGETSVTSDLIAIVVANGAAALVRFVLLRAWVFRRNRHPLGRR